MSIQEARKQLSTAKKHLERVQTASFEPTDEGREEGVTWAFYAYENCVAALAEALELPWKKIHKEKAELASRLHEEGIVSRDIKSTLEELNELRKDVQYGEPGPDLMEVDLEELASELEEFIDEAEQIIERAGS